MSVEVTEDRVKLEFFSKEETIEINIYFEGLVLNHNKQPRHLGVTLNFKEHLLKTQNNIMSKLCVYTWSLPKSVPRYSILSLIYLTAGYSTPIWLTSEYTALVGLQLNHMMSMILGIIIVFQFN